MTVDLLGLSVFLEKSPQHPHPSDPDDFLGHTGVGRTFPLTYEIMFKQKMKKLKAS